MDPLINKLAANQFVSIVIGSEDLHLKNGADAVDTGQNLGTTKEFNIDIDGDDRDALGDDWDIGADQGIALTPPANGASRMFLTF